MIVRIQIDPTEGSTCNYQVTYEAEALYGDEGLPSLADALVAAVEGLSPDVLGVEVWYAGIVSGTYPLNVLAMSLEQIAQHAVNTTAAMQEAGA